MEELSPIPPTQNNDEGAKEQKRVILASLKWGEEWSRRSIYFVQDCNLEQNKMEQLFPIPSKTMMKAPRSKNALFWHHWNGGRGGPDVLFILSKIVACYWQFLDALTLSVSYPVIQSINITTFPMPRFLHAYKLNETGVLYLLKDACLPQRKWLNVI